MCLCLFVYSLPDREGEEAIFTVVCLYISLLCCRLFIVLYLLLLSVLLLLHVPFKVLLCEFDCVCDATTTVSENEEMRQNM